MLLPAIQGRLQCREVRDSPALAAAFRISGFPTLLVLSGTVAFEGGQLASPSTVYNGVLCSRLLQRFTASEY